MSASFTPTAPVVFLFNYKLECNSLCHKLKLHAGYTFLHFMQVIKHCSNMGGQIHRLTTMQWSNFTKCRLFFNIFPAVHTLLLSVLQRLTGVTAALILNLKTKKKSFFLNYSKWGTANSLIVPNQENIEGDRPVQRHSNGQQPLQPLVCRIIVQMNQDFLRYSFEFSGLLRNVSSTTFELPIQCWFIGKGPM